MSEDEHTDDRDIPDADEVEDGDRFTVGWRAFSYGGSNVYAGDRRYWVREVPVFVRTDPGGEPCIYADSVWLDSDETDESDREFAHFWIDGTPLRNPHVDYLRPRDGDSTDE